MRTSGGYACAKSHNIHRWYPLLNHTVVYWDETTCVPFCSGSVANIIWLFSLFFATYHRMRLWFFIQARCNSLEYAERSWWPQAKKEKQTQNKLAKMTCSPQIPFYFAARKFVTGCYETFNLMNHKVATRLGNSCDRFKSHSWPLACFYKLCNE